MLIQQVQTVTENGVGELSQSVKHVKLGYTAGMCLIIVTFLWQHCMAIKVLYKT